MQVSEPDDDANVHLRWEAVNEQNETGPCELWRVLVIVRKAIMPFEPLVRAAPRDEQYLLHQSLGFAKRDFMKSTLVTKSKALLVLYMYLRSLVCRKGWNVWIGSWPWVWRQKNGRIYSRNNQLAYLKLYTVYRSFDHCELMRMCSTTASSWCKCGANTHSVNIFSTIAVANDDLYCGADT